MSDSENNSPNFSEMPPAEDDSNLKINPRSLSVYEQYLKSTKEKLDLEQSSKPSKPFTSRSSGEGTYDFDDLEFDPSIDDATQSTKSAAVIKPHNNTTLYNKTPTYAVANGSSSSSNKYLVMIAGFCALLLIVTIVIVLNATNSLVSISDGLSSVDNKVSQVSNNISVMDSKNARAAAKALAEEKAEKEAQAARLAALNENLNTIAINTRSTESRPATPAVTRVRSMQVGKVDVEPSISYDDFKDEAQNTFYRETN